MSSTTAQLPILPPEVTDRILSFLLEDDDTMDYLQAVPELRSMVINYRRPTTEVSKIYNWMYGDIYTIEDFSRERLLLNYKPNLVESDVTSTCQILDSGVDLSGVKFKITVKPNNSNEQVRRVLENVDVYELVGLDRNVEVKSSLKHLEVTRWSSEFPSQLESLKISSFLPHLMPYIPQALKRLEITDPILHRHSLPTSIRELRIEEFYVAQLRVDLSYLDNLDVFEFKGNVERCKLKHLQDIQLPTTIKSLSLECTSLISLNGLEIFTNLEKLKVIDCPDLVLFFTPEYPSTLTHLEFSFKNCRQKLFERSRVVFQIPGRSPLDAVRFVYANGGFLLAVEDEFQPPPSLRTLILKNHQEIYFGPKLNLPNLQNLVVEKIYRLNCGRLMSGLSTCDELIRLTLKDSSIDCIDDVKLPKNLCHLDLSGNILSSIRNTNLKSLKQLGSMDLNNNRFVSSNNIDIPASLQSLSMSYNKPHIYNFSHTNLTKIDIELPESVSFKWKSFPTTLKYATILGDGHYIDQIPNTFQSLRKLFLYSWFRSLRFETLDFSHLANLYDLDVTRFHPDKSKLLRLPPSIVNARIMYGDKVLSPWPNLTSCKNLKILGLESAAYDEIDLDLLPQSLEKLCISAASALPTCGSLFRLTNLWFLDISQSLVEGIPLFFIDVPQLQVLMVNSCTIRANCADYINCPTIEMLSVGRGTLRYYEGRDAFITFVFGMIAKCPNLKRIFMSDEDAADPVFARFSDLVKPQLGYMNNPELWSR
ncbi:hypothetical protein I9W82_004021 [Candida metapsilosis]|uniref:Uncharacterized protein n=1 Tax=Candida metapsilosis TaxID=273372 RepID=A0A8H8D9S4_9ASCO|nr:hypothetical protein I9W82_004021 [Candida metapsilosis]